ncbi:MAG: outer membrane protein assembly factor BamD, partial [Bdellovibrionales bacterium]
MRIYPLLLLALILPLAACETDEDTIEKYSERPVGDLYNEAQDAMEAGHNTRAAKLFEEVDRQHPYSEWATRAQLQAAYAYYEDREYEKAQATLDRFIQVHPGNENVAYAYYIRALTYYEQIYDVRRDQGVTELAETALR